MPPKKTKKKGSFRQLAGQAACSLVGRSSKTKRDDKTAGNNNSTATGSSPQKQKARVSSTSSLQPPSTPQPENNVMLGIARTAKTQLNAVRAADGLDAVNTGTAAKMMMEAAAGEPILVQPQCPVNLRGCTVKITSGPKYGEMHKVSIVNISYEKNRLWIQIAGEDYKYSPSRFVIILDDNGKRARNELEDDSDVEGRFRHGEKHLYKRFIRTLTSSLRFVNPEDLDDIEVDDTYQKRTARRYYLENSDVPGLLRDGINKDGALYFGSMTDYEHDCIYKPAANKFFSGEFYEWHEKYVANNGEQPSREDLQMELVKYGASNMKFEGGKYILLDEEEQAEQSDLLYEKHCCGENQVRWDPNNCKDPCHFLNKVASGAVMADNSFDAMSGMEDNGPLFHCGNFDPRDHVQAKILDAEAWTTYAQGTNIGNSTLYDLAETTHAAFWQQEANAGNIGAPTLEAYLKEMDGHLCLLGNEFVAEGPGTEIQFSPHLHEPHDCHRVYVRTEASQAMLAHRNKSDRHMWYGHGRPCGKRATLFIISRRYWVALQRVGLTFGNTMDIGSALFPIRAEACHDVDWNGDPGIVNATFTPVQIP